MSHSPRRRPAGSTRRALLQASCGAALVGALGRTPDVSGRALPSAQSAQGGAIDTHIHVVAPGLPGMKSVPKEIEQLYSGPISAMVAHLKAEMERGRVSVAFGMGSLGGGNDDPLGIARTLEIAKSVPGLKAVGIADPTHTDPRHLKAVAAQIEEQRQQIVGLKAYLGYLPFGPEDPNYKPYFRLAAKYHLPVIFHTGDTWSTTAKVKYAHPLRVDEVAVDNPDVQFVIAHFGNPWLIDAAEVVFKNTNVWADLSGLFVGGEKEILHLLTAAKNGDSGAGLVFSDLKKSIGYVADYSKFLYGSDWPLAPMATYRLLIEAMIPKDHHQAVFRSNAERLFGVGGA
jgi:predicted TIM-barrel fold metal-dependent hydrolase